MYSLALAGSTRPCARFVSFGATSPGVRDPVRVWMSVTIPTSSRAEDDTAVPPSCAKLVEIGSGSPCRGCRDVTDSARGREPVPSTTDDQK